MAFGALVDSNKPSYVISSEAEAVAQWGVRAGVKSLHGSFEHIHLALGDAVICTNVVFPPLNEPRERVCLKRLALS